MASTLDNSIQLRLILDGNVTATGVSGTAAVRNPSDVLRGRLEIISVARFEIVEATIFLEGISRNWVTEAVGNEIILKISAAERKFLSQTMDVFPEMVGSTTQVLESSHQVIPFDFIISTITNLSSPRQCLNLPPSLELGSVYIDNSSGKRYAQPSISYQVRAVVTLVGPGEDQNMSAETSSPIIIMPHNEEMPPTDTQDFPAEFKLQESKMMRWSSLGRNIGFMTALMQEPRALIYNSSSIGTSTEGYIHLMVDPTGAGNVHHGLQAMSFKVLSLLRVKTFYSIKSFPQLPGQSFLTTDTGTRLRDDFIKLETQIIPHISWSYTYDMEEHATSSNTAISGGSLLDIFPGQAGGQVVPITSKSDLRPPQGKWTTKISHPIRVDLRLLPTFCSSIVARSYSVILRLKVCGIRKESFDLEIPLQVVHTSPDITSNEATQDLGAPIRAVGEDRSMQDFQAAASVIEELGNLEHRRPSLASWFSEELLESEERPPRYHP